MCGRYTITVDADSIAWRFGAERPEFEFEPVHNAAPTQSLPVIIETESQRQVVMMRWGLIPFWSKDMSIGNKLINARVETVHQKPAFKKAFYQSRCLIPADGYYEWLKVNGRKQPMRIISTQQNIFSFAGIWDRWVSPEGTAIHSFSILTTPPVDSIRHIHNRMPLILPLDQEDDWLKGPPEWSPQAVQHFLSSIIPFSALKAYSVSTRVNNPQINDPSLITAVE